MYGYFFILHDAVPTGQVICYHRSGFHLRRSATSVVQNVWLWDQDVPGPYLAAGGPRNFLHCDGFSMESAWYIVRVVPQPTGLVFFNSSTLKASFGCLGAWMKFEGNGDMDKNFEAIWAIKDVLLSLFRSSLYSSSQELRTFWEGLRE